MCRKAERQGESMYLIVSFPQVLLVLNVSTYTQRIKSVVILFPRSKVLRTSGKFSVLDTDPGYRVVIQTYFSAFFCFTFLGRVSVCVCSESERSASLIHSGLITVHAHSDTDTLKACLFFTVPVSLPTGKKKFSRFSLRFTFPRACISTAAGTGRAVGVARG